MSKVRFWRRFLFTWDEFWAIVRCFERREDLIRLIKWAERRKLTGPLSLYRGRFADEEARIQRFRYTLPRALFWASVIYRLQTLLAPPPTFCRKGSASRYRTKS